jgi:threonine/homoserine/homoserine lactone efflux protein
VGVSGLGAAAALYGEGVLLGIVPVFFVGPVLFTLLNAALDEGFGAGARVALGIAVSDVVAIGLCAAGVGPLLTLPLGQLLLSVGGGLILLGFGLVLALGAWRDAAPAGPAAEASVAPSGARSRGRHFVAGFAVNFVNPFVFTFWIGALGGVQARHGLGWEVVVPVFGGMVTTILVTDLLKAALAGAVSSSLGERGLRWARGASGVLLGVAGLWLLVHGLASDGTAALLSGGLP